MTTSPVKRVAEVFAEVDDPGLMARLFNEIFTPAEIQDVALRWRLMEMLNEGVSQRQIASELGISLCKITRGSKVLKKRSSVSKRILNQNRGEDHAGKKTSRSSTG